ncbi:MAG: polysaccharide deacetylase family protein, partial [Bacteroidota bacterium]
PQWCKRGELGEAGIYYGTEFAGMGKVALCMPLQESTVDYFCSRTPYDINRICWREDNSGRYPVLFGGSTPEEDDIIASSFFWLSGWQEYTISNRDRHGRFPYEVSLQAVLGTIHEPVVDKYREVLQRKLLQISIPVKHRRWGEKDWAFCPTHDIDYLRKWRPGMVYREVVEHFLANGRRETISARVSRLSAFLADAARPGDIFRKALTRMIDEVASRGGKATYFIKTGAHGPHDVFYRPTHSFLRRTLRRLKTLDFEVGLHPSYYAHTHPDYLAQEKITLEKVWDDSVVSIRQHYLRYEAPLTPRLQEGAGFSIDSSLAFADHEGFRNGTCHPFLRFDIGQNKAGGSWEMPLCFMDGTLFNYRNFSTDEAVAVSEKLILQCKRYKGVCVGLWHNTLWDEMDFAGWGEHFLRIMDAAVRENANIDSLKNLLGVTDQT